MPDLSAREWLMLGPIAAAVLWMGVYPESFLAPMRADIAALNARVARAAPEGDARLAIGRAAPPVIAERDGHGPPAPTIDPAPPPPVMPAPMAAPEGAH
jgi:NADH-quinone oxidoreductase subunit M